MLCSRTEKIRLGDVQFVEMFVSLFPDSYCVDRSAHGVSLLYP